MLRELEQRLAVVLGADLPGPLAGRVTVRPEARNGDDPAAQISIRQVQPVTPDFGAVRTEVTPGDPAARRIVRLSVDLEIRLTSGGADARDNRVSALDDLLYFLDAPDMRSGAALRDTGDPGFLLESLTLADADFTPSLSDPVSPDVRLTAVGWFWPVGQPGQDGPAIAEARISQFVFPVSQDPQPARFVAGAGATEIALSFTDTQRIALTEGTPLRWEQARLAFALLAADGGAGAGRLGNGRSLGDGVRSRPLIDGMVSVRYTPPDAPGVDRLIVRRVDEGETDRFGPILIEVPLITEGAP